MMLNEQQDHLANQDLAEHLDFLTPYSNEDQEYQQTEDDVVDR